MTPEMRKAVLEYAQILKKDGNKAAEQFIDENEKKYPGDFRKWCHAIRFMVRVGKIRGKDGYQGDG